MALVVVGVNPRRAPFSLLARSLGADAARAAVLSRLADHRSVSEVLLLASGERAEVYAVVEDGADAYEVVLSQLTAAGVLGPDGAAHGYFAEGIDAAAHLFAAVAASDEFAVDGEEVPRALAAAAAASRARGVLGSRLETLTSASCVLAARLEASDAGESVDALGETVAELSRRVFDHLERRRALIVGASSLASAAARALADIGVGHLVWVGATGGADASDAVVQPNTPMSDSLIAPLAFTEASPEALPVLLGSADIVVAAPGAVPVLDKRLVKSAMRTRRGRPMLLVDVSEDGVVIEPRVASVDDAFLYTRADLVQLTDDAPWARASAAGARDALVTEAVRNFSYQLA